MTSHDAGPHLTPAKLVGQRFPRNTFGRARIALVGYCPPPKMLDKYMPVTTTAQFFIHVPPESVKTFSHNGMDFVSLAHVYGGPVSATTVEELAYYQFDYVLAYGLAGGLGTKNLRMGDFYLVESAYADDGTTRHYSSDTVIPCDAGLQKRILDLWQVWQGENCRPMHAVRAFTGDALYQEDDAYLADARSKGCDIVNLDSSHLYAVSRRNNEQRQMASVECGVLSDVASTADQNWDSTLSVMLSAKGSESSKGSFNPLELTGDIVAFYVERLALVLLAEA